MPWAASPVTTPVTPSIKNPAVPQQVEEGFNAWLQMRMGADANPAAYHKLRGVLEETWRAAIEWYQQQQGTMTAHTAVVQDAILVPKPLLERVIVTLEGVTDLPDDQQSPELLTLITTLKELVE